MRVSASVSLLFEALASSFLEAFARSFTTVHSEFLCLKQNTSQHDKRKFKKCMLSIGFDTFVAELSLFFAHEFLSEKFLDLMFVDFASIVNARFEFTTMNYKAKFIVCDSFSSTCCIYNAFFYTCIDRMLFRFDTS